MPIRLLGLMGVHDGDREIALGPPRHRALFAQLAVHRNRAVATEALAEGLWGGAEPSSWRAQVQSAVSALRRALSSLSWIELRSVPTGYCLAVADDHVDLAIFEDLVARANRSTTGAAALLRDALALWSELPLTGVQSPFADAARIRIGELRLSAYEQLADAVIADGQPGTVAAELADLVEQHPFREGLRSRLMIVLARTGRQADALRLAAEGRTLLRDELGVDPGPELQEAQRAVLSGELGPVPAAAVPAQLPAEPATFVSRSAELAELQQAITTHRVLVLSGPGGAGKSALAVRFAHRIAEAFPDGQLYVDLRGFSMGTDPLDSLEVVRRFLRAFGTARDQLPDDLAEGETKLRSVLAGRRVLLLLDNARNADQVRPLLPGTDTCLALVTSRSELRSLVVRESAHRVKVGELSPTDSLDLVRRVAGESRPAAEPDAAAAIVNACGGMPLALRIVGELIDRRRDQPLADLADDLRDAGHRLDILDTGDGASDTSVRAVTSWSYHALPTGTARFFCLLGVHPGVAFDVAAASWLTGTEPVVARRELDLLASLHLVEPAGSRYRLHDLLRVYAAERAAECPAEDLAAARERLAGWYLATANAAVEAAQRPLWYRALPAGLPVPPTFGTVDRALAWLEREWDNLLAVLGMTADHSLAGMTKLLGERIGRFAGQHHTLSETTAIYQVALDVAERDGDVDGQRTALQGLAIVAGRTGDNATSLQRLHRLLALVDDDTSPQLRADALNNLGNVHNLMGELDRAAGYFESALEVYQAAGLEQDRVASVGNLAIVQWKRGLLAEAEVYLTEATKLAHEFSSPLDTAAQTANLAHLQVSQGFFDRAADTARQAVRKAEDAGSPMLAAYSTGILAEALLGAGHLTGARQHIDEATAAAAGIDTAELHLQLARVRGACAERLGENAQALAEYRSCLRLADAADDRYTQTDVWIGIARTENAGGRPGAAKDAARRAAELAERYRFGLLEERARALLG